MKKILPVLIFCLLIFQGIRAQSPINITEGNMEFGESTIPAFTVVIPEADYESTLKEWINLLESGTRSKVVTEDGRMSIFGAKIKSVSENPVNVYSQLERGDSTINLNVAIELEKDKYAENSKSAGVREYLVDFAKERYLAVVDDQLDHEKKVLREYESELKSMDRGESKGEKSIRKYNDLISSEEQKISEFNDELSSISSDLSRFEMGGMGAPESETGEDAMKDLEKKQKEINREIRKSEKKIKKAERHIEKSEDEISEINETKDEARYRVLEQESVVQRLEAKRDVIKNYR